MSYDLHKECENGKLCKKCYHRKWSILNTERIKKYRKIYYQLNKEKIKQRVKEWVQANPEKKLLQIRKYRLKYPEKNIARGRLNDAIRYGKLKRCNCHICGGKAEAHHADYSKPLKVEWLCPVHHSQKTYGTL